MTPLSSTRRVNKQGFLQHINSVDPAIRFTVEDNKEDGSIPFLDTIVKPEADGFSVHYCIQETHTYTPVFTVGQPPSPLSQVQCHPTLSHRASTMCSNPELLQKEKEHLGKALTKCNYPKWALDKVENRLNRPSRQVNEGGNSSAQSANHGVQSKGHIVIPTHKVFVKVSKRSVVDMASKLTPKVAEPSKTFWSPPRTKTQCSTQIGSIYWYQCGDLGCDDEYIGETSGPLVKDTKST